LKPALQRQTLGIILIAVLILLVILIRYWRFL
jgi:hypothetical protein